MIELPSLQALDRAQASRIWLATEATDMRCGFDRLAERVRGVIGQDPLSGHLFVFRSRRGDRLKILLWDRQPFSTVRQTPSPSGCRSGRMGLRKPQCKLSFMKVIHGVLPSSSKNIFVSFVKRVGVPLSLPSVMKD
jgi:IS66 Orf2 like protein